MNWWGWRWGIWIAAITIFVIEATAFIYIRAWSLTQPFWINAIAFAIGLTIVAFHFIGLGVFGLAFQSSPITSVDCPSCDNRYLLGSVWAGHEGSASIQVARGALSASKETPDLITSVEDPSTISTQQYQSVDAYMHTIARSSDPEYWRCQRCMNVNRYPTAQLMLYICLYETLRYAFKAGLLVAGLLLFSGGPQGFSSDQKGVYLAIPLITLCFGSVFLNSWVFSHVAKKLEVWELLSRQIAEVIQSGDYRPLILLAIEKDPDGKYTKSVHSKAIELGWLPK